MNINDIESKAANEANLRQMTADVVSAYVGSNPVQASDLSKIIADVHGALSNLKDGKTDTDEISPKPAVDPKRSVKPDRIICLECGQSFKSLKRHLMSAHGMTPEEYRAKWGLPADYPMVAPNYSAKRSALAKDLGLGRKPGQTVGG